MFSWFLNMPMTKKLVLVLVVMGLLPAIIIGGIASNEASELLEKEAHNSLLAVRDARKSAIERYFNRISDQISVMSQQQTISDATSNFIRGYNRYIEQSKEYSLAQAKNSVSQYYQNDFATEFKSQNKVPANANKVIEKLTPTTLALQQAYISDNPNPLGAKDALPRGVGSASYHAIHQRYHPEIREFLQKFAYYDIFLVDVKTGNIIYSVYKELDFATSLMSGPYANTNFADVFKVAAKDLNKGETALSDYQLYYPSYQAPASFIASPVYDGEEKIGVLIFQMPIAEINKMMTDRSGMGESGETYLVGPDHLMRSDSYLDPVNHSVVNSFRNPELGAVKTPVIEKALDGKSGEQMVIDYNGNPVFSAYAPMSVLGLNWAILAEIDVAEALAPVSKLQNIVLMVVVIALIILLVVAYILGKALSSPISELSKVLNKITSTGDFSIRVKNSTKDEVGQAANGVNQLLQSLGDCFGEAKNVLEGVAKNDFTMRLEKQYNGDMAALAKGMNETVEQLDEMQKDQKTQSQALEKSAEESNLLMKKAQDEAIVYGRIKQALDACSTNIMIANQDHDIVYMNESVNEMLKDAEQDIKKDLPSFNVKGVLNSNVDIFHKNPNHQRSMLAALNDTYRTKVVIGGRTFTLVANPINDEQHNRIGTVVEWNDVTEELKRQNEAQRIANENARIKQALDACSTNVMIGDADNNVIYMNQAVTDMMHEVESDLQTALPNFNADKIMGNSIDIYHKDPSHQRSMLAKLNKTYQTEIEIGGRTFSLTANPISSDSGERIGTVVEWNDRTQEVKVESEVNTMIDAASRGDYSARMNLEGKQGFFEKLAFGLNKLSETTDIAISDVVRVLSSLANGDLTQKIEGHYEGLFSQLKDDTNQTVDKLTEVIGEVLRSSTAVHSGADELAQGNANLSQRTEEQASSLEETAASMEEMTANVKQSEEGAKQAAGLASLAQSRAEQGGAVVDKAVSAMEGINASSKKIADIIGVIDEIAFQTNLLALNAAVEAARAGEQGKGFAVVAGEVRSLAQRSAGAAKEIKDLIRDSVDKVTDGAQLVNKSGSTLKEILDAVNNVDSVVRNISEGAVEQTAGINQVNVAVSQMDSMTQQNAALVEQAAAASEAMAEQAKKMQQILGFFKTKNSA
ncbi:hypothetical protein NBRC116188_15010 [Oceaniserpentilla sp. 4NH20-0058]|uniref:methyl-accepting chemotaxis protein n=1 Tax=Oceaniserpentilla sp. 4NH20-0058 TaxID=3127660 RepID=UPI003104AE9F